SDFYRPANAELFRAVLEVADREEPVDAVTVAEELRRRGRLEEVGGKPFLHTLVSSVPTPGSARHYGATVRQYALRRELLEFSQTLGRAATMAELPEAAQLVRHFSDEVDRRMADDEATTRPVRGCSAAELLQMEMSDPHMVVDEIVPEGLTMLAGKPKIGKSFMALSVAIAVSSGGVALNRMRIRESGGALYLALEDNPRRLKRRLVQLLQSEPPPRGLRLEWEWPKLQEGGLDRLRLWVEQHPRTKLIVVDTLQKVRAGPKTNGSLYAEDYEALGALKALADRYEIAVVVLHHLSKREGGDALDQVLGTTGMTGVPDTILTLKRERNRPNGVLYVTGRDVDEVEWAMRFDPLSGMWSVIGDAEELRRSEERDDVMALLRTAGETMSPKEIAEALDRNQGSTKVLLHRMTKAGEVVKLGYGKYGLAEQSRNPGNSGNPSNGVTPVTLEGTVAELPVTAVTAPGDAQLMTLPLGDPPADQRSLAVAADASST
ncbi:MAG: AAA family ATPase, partial [Actinomycetota bacterium]